MPHPRKPRHSRKNDIPRDYILNWQSSRGRGAKPLMRRPPTACEACRVAKVKCNGKQPECGRCTDRGIDCKYTGPSSADISKSTGGLAPSPVNSAQPSPSTIPTLTEPWPALSQIVPEDISLALGMDNADQLDSLGAEYVQASETWSDWTNGVALSGPAQLDWLSTDMSSLDPMDQDWLTPSSPPTSTSAVGSVFPVQALSQPKTAQENLAQEVPVQPSTSENDSYGLNGNSSESTTPSTYASQSTSLSLPHQRTPTGSCLCRAGAVLMVPKVKDALYEKQTDLVFQVMGDVIKSCQNIMDCAVYEVKCTDLICIMSVLQHTDACFEFVAKAKLASGIKVSIGNYEASGFDEARLRHMLVTDLVRQTHMLLDSINITCQKMCIKFETHCRPGLARVNLDYLKAAVEDFRHVLSSVMESVDGSGPNGGHLLRQPANRRGKELENS